MKNNLKSDCKSLIQCVCCGSTVLVPVLDLNTQPPANSYTTGLTETELQFPLGLNYCPICAHLQLTHAVDPDILFKNYLYVSGTTDTMHAYFRDFVDLTLSYMDNHAQDSLRVLDIACNDGCQLDYYRMRGHQTYGIDPAENLHKISSQRHRVECDYLTTQSIQRLGVDQYDIILAQNVFAHNSYPLEFLKICRDHVSTNGKIFIQTSQAHMLELGQFDTVYHEHISFFNIESMSTLAQRAGLYVQDVRITPVHGGSYVFVLTTQQYLDCTGHLLEQEPARRMEDVWRFAQAAQDTVQQLKAQIEQYRSQGYVVAGYGAAAKGNTVLNFGAIQLDFIVDDSPLKQGHYTPGRKIPILSMAQAQERAAGKKVAWFVLGWNFIDEIRTRVHNARPGAADVIIPIKFTKPRLAE